MKKRTYEELADKIEGEVSSCCKDPHAFAVILEGDSMDPEYHAGDRVVFSPNAEPRNGEPVIAKHKDGRVFFKYYFRMGEEGAHVKLVSQNSNYSPLEFPRGRLRVHLSSVRGDAQDTEVSPSTSRTPLSKGGGFFVFCKARATDRNFKYE